MKKIKVLYEDSNILAVDKPSGILTCPDQRTDDPSTSLRIKENVFDIFKKKYPKLELVHRLDKETSGVLLFAKNKKAHEFLKGQFQSREIKKTYLTIVNGSVKNDHGIINKPIGRSPADFRRRLAGRGARGEMREAITEYKVLGRYKDYTFLEVEMKTGRRHQIRCHFSYLKHPIAGDKLYAFKNSKIPDGLTRQFLHAQKLKIQLPNGSAEEFISELPEELKKILNALEK